MRFRRYINEAIIRSDTEKLKAIKKILVNAKEEFDKRIDDASYLDVEDVLSDIIDKIQKLFKDVKFYKSERMDVEALTVPAKDLKTFEIHLNFDSKVEAYEAFQAQNYKWDMWLNWAMSAFKHELIHVEQLRRLSKEKDPEKAFAILKGIMLKQRSSGDRMEGYLSNALEIMAHANTASKQLRDFLDHEKLMTFIKTSKGHDYLKKYSKSFRYYYDNIRGKYPKVWKRFLKYVMQYLERRNEI